MTKSESFRAAWPQVLVEMKDFIDLYFLALGNKRQSAALTVFISKVLVPRAQLQPHMQEFRASLLRIPNCRVEFKGTEEAAHRIDIETLR